MKKFVIFNWKMNPDSPERAVRLAKLTNNLLPTTNNKVEVVIAPPFIFLDRVASAVAKRYGRLRFASQDAFWINPAGPYTGEISPQMLKNSGVDYVILGHSERRTLGETDEIIGKKVKAVTEAGMAVILCVGEAKREKGKAKSFIKRQLEKDLSGLSTFNFSLSSLIIAYEPVWAISTAKGVRECTPAYAAEMITYIKKLLTPDFKLSTFKVLYGGSVNGKNIKGFANESVIDGVLVGGASLKKEEIKKIISVYNKYV